MPDLARALMANTGKGRTAGPHWMTPQVTGGMTAAADGMLIALAGFLADLLEPHPMPLPGAVPALLLAIVMALNLFQFAGLYRFEQLAKLDFQIPRLWLCLAATGAILITVGFATGSLQEVPRTEVLSFVTLAGLGTSSLRLFLGWRIPKWQKAGRLVSNVVVVGAGEHGRRLVAHLREAGPALRLIGLFDDRRDRVPDYVGGYPVLGTVADLEAFVRRHPIDQIILALPWGAEERLRCLVARLSALPVDLRLSPDYGSIDMCRTGITHVAGVPTFRLVDRPLSGWDGIQKAIEDRVIATSVLLFTLPLMLVIALAIRLTSPGPVLYRQLRYGFNNRPIRILKFRTMRIECCDDGVHGAVPQVRPGDPRVTPVGRLLRRYSLDELPQFINVLRGEMSVVGPRPHAVAHNRFYAELIGDYLARHKVRPGITGWAQVNGLRGETRTIEEMRRRIQYDLYYVENWSLLFDLRIILRTLLVGFRDPSA